MKEKRKPKTQIVHMGFEIKKGNSTGPDNIYSDLLIPVLDLITVLGYEANSADLVPAPHNTASD